MATTSENRQLNLPSVDHVSVKVPPFIPSDPELWFTLLESSFDAAGITRDGTRYGYAVSSLDPKYAVEVRDILIKPASERSYVQLKSELIKRMGSSQEHNTRRLLENEPLGDRKPSQFLRHLRGLAGAAFPEDLLQTLWLGRLPKQVQALLAGHKDLSLDKRADIADSVADVYGPLAVVSEAANGSASINTRLDFMQNALTTALQELAAIKMRQEDDRPRRSMRQRSRSRSRPRSRGQEGMCWYHWKFGQQANKCQNPCNFSAAPAENERGSR